MSLFVAVENIEKSFPLSGGNEYLALKGIDLEIKQGEFISLIGHSGCGKSTLLNLIAGLELPTDGAVSLEGQQITAPGPDRMVVFQNYSLFPWLTVRENIALAVDEVLRDLPKEERQAIVEEHIQLVGLGHAADKPPAQLSGGMKQRVAIARGLATRPKLLLLDEPFGALDALTRGNLQEKLMQICEENHVTAVMVTHDVDEAVLLSDRIVMLTNGPGSKIGGILEVDIPRPRKRMDVVHHPSYYSLRSEIIYFLNQQKRVKKLNARKVTTVARHGLEKVNLEIGYVPLMACAPLVVAQEKGFFAKHGLDEVSLVRETSWRGIVDGLSGNYLDAAQMPSGMPVWMSVGGHGDRPLPIVSSLTMSRNGNGITLSKALYDEGIRTVDDFRNLLRSTADKQHIMGIVHPASMHNLLLRYWLAANQIDPDREVQLRTIPPAQMVADLKDGTIDGYCIGEPWNAWAAQKDVGFTIANDLEIWNGHPGKVLGVREDWANRYPNSHVALVKALLEACQYCEDPANWDELRDLLSDRRYLSCPKEYIQFSQTTDGSPDLTVPHHRFAGAGVNRPSRTEHLWIMTQLARWGDIPFPRNWVEILERVCRVGVFSTAARELGLSEVVSYQRTTPVELFDGVPFNAEDPIAYLNSLPIHRDFSVAEIALDQPRAIAA